MSRLLNVVYALVLGIQCRDISTNFKLYYREDIFGLPLRCRNFDVIEEILVHISAKYGSSLVITEVPDHFHDRKYGVTKRRLGPFTLSYILTLIRLRLRTPMQRQRL